MAVYTSDKVALRVSAETAFDKLQSPGALRPILEKVDPDQIPADKRAMFDQLELTDDSITIPGGPVGTITLRVSERERPRRIVLTGEGIPVPLSVRLDLEPTGEDSCDAQVAINLGVPKMLEPMIGGTIQKVADQFAGVLRTVPLG